MNIKTIDMDTLIDIFNQLAKQKDEFTEQDAGGGESAGASSGGGSPSVPKWADGYQLKRGKANMLGKQGEKWNTGISRGPANQIW
jgi:hypothetical protein